MAGGGVASPSDPLEGTQYSEEELTAIVQEARAARTYVMAHAYTPESISRAITKSGAIEIWNYGDGDGARLTFHLERTGRGELKVIEFVNGR